MPYSAEHKLKTRQRIVACARQLFTTRGFSEVSIDEIMAEAGLTRGGFYNHFKNKDELFAEALATTMGCDCTGDQRPQFLDYSQPPTDLARQFIDAYLSEGHLESGEHQCPLIALPSDVARAGPAVKDGFQKLFEGMIGIFEKSLEPAGGRASRERAYALAATCVGGMVLARAMGDPAIADTIRTSALAAAHDTLTSEPCNETGAAQTSNGQTANGQVANGATMAGAAS